MEKHINVVAILQIGLSIFNLILVILFYTIMSLIGGFINDPEGSVIIELIAKVISIFLILISIPGILASIGIYKRKEWGRVLAILIGAVQLFCFPIGTAIGIYTIWALIQPESIKEFETQKT